MRRNGWRGSKGGLLGTVLAVALVGGLGVAQARDTVVIGQQQEPPVLDPTADATAVIDTIMSGPVFEQLTAIDEKSNVVPSLAKSWTVSEDGLVYTFTLEPGVKYTDGNTLDSAAVKFSFERAMAPDSTNPTKGIFKPIAKIDTPDPTTVVITLSSPDNLFLFHMSRGDASIVHPATANDNKTKPVGSGPYALKEWLKGDRVVLTRNDGWRNAKSVKMKDITFKFLSDPAASIAALLAGDLDAFPTITAVESLDQFKKDARFVVGVGLTEGEVVLALNNRRKPFDDLRVRRAIAHALDRKAIIDGAMFGYGTPIGSFFPPHHPAYVDQTGRYPHDIAKAKALMAEAGLKDGAEITLQPPPFPYAKRSAEIVAQQLAAIGLKVKIQNVEWPFWIAEIFRKGQYDMTIVAHVEPNDFNNFSRGKDYYWGYHDPAMDELLTRIRTEPDQKEVATLLGDFQRKAADDAVMGYLFQLAQTGVYRKGLKGYWTSSPGGATTPWKNLYWE
ncbi:MAG: ABC transporter substrate-binding protein [Alphaproteobacteria bacterium]|nr:ABC transporter substrate-binding protein [Alphaproteobacteria bacterium]